MDLLNIEDHEVAHNQSLDLLDLMSYTDSVAVHHFVGTESELLNFVRPEDCTNVLLHDHEKPAAQIVCRSDRQRRATATATSKAQSQAPA